MRTLYFLAKAAGVTFSFRTEVTAVAKAADGYLVGSREFTAGELRGPLARYYA